MRKQIIALLAIFGVLMTVIPAGFVNAKGEEKISAADAEDANDAGDANSANGVDDAAGTIDGAVVSVTGLDFTRPTKNQIAVIWNDSTDPYVLSYTVYRRNAVYSVGQGEWKNIGTVNSDRVAGGNANIFIDSIKGTKPQQFEYMVTVNVADASVTPGPAQTMLASNIKVCIDPGHFAYKNAVGGVNPYCEGNFTLLIGVDLFRELKKYGISACMTRYSGSIVIGGYADEDLDSAHIRLRGEYAAYEGCDLFVSLHTNSNQDNAHGYPTFEQPMSINHPLVIVNVPATKNAVALNAANSIGYNLVNENRRAGISTVTNYIPASTGAVTGWNDTINDELNGSGRTVCRLNSRGQDYYGVLKGSASKGIPGMIIEHGFHSVPEVRKAAAAGNLDDAWAKADAYGIAFGYGFVQNIVY